MNQHNIFGKIDVLNDQNEIIKKDLEVRDVKAKSQTKKTKKNVSKVSKKNKNK